MNLHAGADPEDMISLGVWLDDHRVTTARLRDIVAIEEAAIPQVGPRAPGHGAILQLVTRWRKLAGHQ